MTVWDRQDGANAALKSHTEQQRFRFYFTPSLLSSGGCYELTWCASMSSWPHSPGSECTATVPQTGSAHPCRCSPPSAAPHQTATAQQTQALHRKKWHVRSTISIQVRWTGFIQILFNSGDLQRATVIWVGRFHCLLPLVRAGEWRRAVQSLTCVGSKRHHLIFVM